MKKKYLYSQVISDIKKIASFNNVVSTDDILEIINSFSQTWFSLQSYDEGTIPQSGFTKTDLNIDSADLYRDVSIF